MKRSGKEKLLDVHAVAQEQMDTNRVWLHFKLKMYEDFQLGSSLTDTQIWVNAYERKQMNWTQWLRGPSSLAAEYFPIK